MSKDGILARIQELGQLSDGWHNGDGIAPDKAALDKLAQAFVSHYGDDLAEPHLYPTYEGNVLAEWWFDHHDADVSLDINLKDFSGYFHVLRTNTGKDWEFELQLDPAVTTDGWQKLNSVIRSFCVG